MRAQRKDASRKDPAKNKDQELERLLRSAERLQRARKVNLNRLRRAKHSVA